MVNIFFRYLRNKKNTAIACGGLIYILGYMVWSINSYKNNLGLLSAFEVQYFMSGLFPFMIVAISFIVYQVKNIIVNKFERKVSETSNKAKLYGIVIVLAIVMIGEIVLALFIAQKISNPFELGGVILITGLGVLILLFHASTELVMSLSRKVIKEIASDPATLVVNSRFENTSKVINGIIMDMSSQNAKGGFKLVIVLISVYLSLAYSLILYPSVPQEFGGMQPKPLCIVFKEDIKKDSILSAIENQCVDSMSERGNEYQSVFKSDDKILLRRKSDKSTIEINPKDIEYIKWK